ncbi:MAG TPA: dihydrodipicolinate synthase family protein [Bryobacteraceae bacterium]|nr:dihydrodipicolinate synthase family protein [Bryobacteraceae bacterium]
MNDANEIQNPGRREFFGAMAGGAAASAFAPQALSAQAKKAKEPFRGVFTIPSTPFKENGEIDIASFRRMVDFCVACGAHGLVFPVNASEWTVLSDEERLQLDKVLVEQNAGRIPVVIGAQAASAEWAAKFAAHAREIGADAVIAMPPRGESAPAVLFDYYRRIAEAGRLPVFVQDHDPPAGTPMPVELLGRLCREIEQVKYLKEEASPTTFKMTAVLKTAPWKGVFGGAGGRYLIEEHRRGCAGQMPGCHVTDVVVALWNALEQGDEVRAMHIYKEMAPLFFFETQLGGCYKEVLHRRGVISCPLKRNGAMPMDATASKYLDQILKALEPLTTVKRNA